MEKSVASQKARRKLHIKVFERIKDQNGKHHVNLSDHQL